jgi:5,10-methylenetetrahydrofolate reductase
MKVTDAIAQDRSRPVFIADFSPPRSGDPALLADASKLDVEFICVAYNPGKAVRIDSATAAWRIAQDTGRGAMFNLSPRGMNQLALQSRLLGAQAMGLENVLVLQGDPVSERDGFAAVSELTASKLIASIAGMNEGTDFKGSKLRAPTDFCIGASADLGRGVAREAALTGRKVTAGAQFIVTQPVFDAADIAAFREAYASAAGSELDAPVFWGLQILVADGVIFSNVPRSVRDDLERGRDGVDIALEAYGRLLEFGVDGIYLVSPIMRGGARDYDAAARFMAAI